MAGNKYTFQIEEATKKQQRARVGLFGPAGSGKTYTALLMAETWAGLIAEQDGIDVKDVKIGVIDTEHHSARVYSGEPWVVTPYHVIELDPPFALDRCTAAIHALEDWGAHVIIFDSISHPWAGRGGALSEVDKNAVGGGGKFTAWRKVTPKHEAFFEAITRCKAHVIGCARSKMAHAMITESGKTRVEKLGLQPILRDGAEYEFDIAIDMIIDGHTASITKTRCRALDGAIVPEPGEELAKTIFAWLGAGAPPPPPASVDQKGRIVNRLELLIPKLDTTNSAAVDAVLVARSLPKLDDLTEKDADALIVRLDDAPAKKWTDDESFVGVLLGTAQDLDIAENEIPVALGTTIDAYAGALQQACRELAQYAIAKDMDEPIHIDDDLSGVTSIDEPDESALDFDDENGDDEDVDF